MINLLSKFVLALCFFIIEETEVQREVGVHMKKYEIMYIVKASLDEAQFEKIKNRLHNTIIENGGSIDEFNDWGIKDFAYEIDHMKKGHYVVINATANNEGIFEFQRLARINNDVVRIMVVKTEGEK